jgi:hypothetical protein
MTLLRNIATWPWRKYEKSSRIVIPMPAAINEEKRLGGKKVKFNVKKLHFRRIQTKSEFIRHLEDEKSSSLVGQPFL